MRIIKMPTAKDRFHVISCYCGTAFKHGIRKANRIYCPGCGAISHRPWLVRLAKIKEKHRG